MAVEAREAGYTFPYLVDASQDVAKAYQDYDGLVLGMTGYVDRDLSVGKFG